MSKLLHWRPWLLHLALIAWVTGFWWCSGRWEHNRWLQWIVLPVFAINADHVWALWKEWLGSLALGLGLGLGSDQKRDLWWFALFSLIEWQFWLTGIRTGDWWGGPGSGKDLIILIVLLSSLVLLARDLRALTWLWRSVLFVAALALGASACLFYADYGISEERFRLGWRSQPGFNAVTTGLLVGFALVVAWGPWANFGKRFHWVHGLVLFLFGALLAASESRGALLAVSVAFVAQAFLWFQKSDSPSKGALRLFGQLLPSLFGFLGYWFLALRVGESSSALVARGSAGRLEIYRHYLADLSVLDWVVGKGHVPSLPPSELGWLVHHPHSAYLGQLVGYGLLGSILLAIVLLAALWKIRARPELPLVLFGLTACLFDGGQLVSALTLARWETLVVLVPLIIAVTQATVASERSASLSREPSREDPHSEKCP